MPVGDISHQQAMFWMNIHLELLASHKAALQRMRTLALQSDTRHDCDADVRLLEAETNRILARLSAWEVIVDWLCVRPTDEPPANGPKALHVTIDGIFAERRRHDRRSVDGPARFGPRLHERRKALATASS